MLKNKVIPIHISITAINGHIKLSNICVNSLTQNKAFRKNPVLWNSICSFRASMASAENTGFSIGIKS